MWRLATPEDDEVICGKCLDCYTRGFICAVTLGLTLTVPQRAAAQDVWALENHGYFDPVLAEPRAAHTTALFPARADSFPFAVKDGASLVWDISVGTEIPIVGFSSSRGTESPVGVGAGHFGLGIWLPLSFHMIEDLSKDPSIPILNTDYRFAGLVKAQWGLADNAAFWSSAHLGAKFQFGHESTHIGDEFTLGALRIHPAEFIRVNLSYEYYEVAASFEPNVGGDGRYQIKLRAGTIWLWRPDDGWYSPELLQPFGQFIARSRRNHEPYAQVEFYRQPGEHANLGLVLSADLRDRTIYQYVAAPDASRRNNTEPTQWSTNIMAGVRQIRSGAGLLGKLTPTYFFRIYRGVNPNGQFRSQWDFNEIGVGVHIGF